MAIQRLSERCMSQVANDHLSRFVLRDDDSVEVNWEQSTRKLEVIVIAYSMLFAYI